MYEEENEDELRDEYEYYDDWKDSEARDYGVSLDDYEYSRKVEDYGI